MDVQSTILPDSLKPLAGKIMDIDGHEMAPAQCWVDMYGEEAQLLVDAFTSDMRSEAYDANAPYIPDYAGDILEIDADIQSKKGARAPGAVEQVRRLKVLDTMGLSRQLLFPSHFAMTGAKLQIYSDDLGYLPVVKQDRYRYGRRVVELYNEWVVKTGKISERIRPVAQLSGETPEEVIATAGRLVEGGVRAVLVPSGILIGGVSPAHPDLDPLWALLESAKCAVTLHIGEDGGFVATNKWRDIPGFEGYRTVSEFRSDPWSLATIHMAYQNFVIIMVTGGVFHRFPDLRFGVIEAGAYWLGNLIEIMDFWYQKSSSFIKFASVTPGDMFKLPEPPSYYVKRNIRVTPFVFEDVGAMLDRYDLGDVLCFSTDYPHVEGGKDAFGAFYRSIERLGPEQVEKFFVTNGQFLLPD